MKIYILTLILISATTFAQDYSKLKSNQLIDTINKKNEYIKKLNNTISQYKKKQDELLNKNDDSKVVENFKNVIKDDNNYWLKDLFEKKYTDNYFTETDLESDDITQKIIKSNVYINSIKSVEENRLVIEKCNQALEFNKNYNTLYTIKNSVLNEKYNEKNVNEAISNIEKLPKLHEDSKLDKTKTRILNTLKNYLDSTCSLKKKLDGWKNAECKSPPMQKLFTSLENDDSYKGYDYLVKVIRKMRNNKIDYTNDDLQPCPEASKENVQTKVIEPKTGK